MKVEHPRAEWVGSDGEYQVHIHGHVIATVEADPPGWTVRMEHTGESVHIPGSLTDVKRFVQERVR